MPPTPQLIVLFDIDHTLIDYPMNRQTVAGALDAATGTPDLLDQIDWQGTTDRWLATEAARITDLPVDPLYERFADAYTRILGEHLARLPSTALPGCTSLLHRLTAQHAAVLGISTGNTRRNAILKLEHAELSPYFTPLRGGFGDEYADRADLVRAAARECDLRPGDRLVVLGDTACDVRSALAAGAIAIGVATGDSTTEDLRTAGAAVALPHLRDLDAALESILHTTPSDVTP